jgi:hypothetical protein
VHQFDCLAALEAEEFLHGCPGKEGVNGHLGTGQVFQNLVNSQQPRGFVGHEGISPLLYCAAQLCGM